MRIKHLISGKDIKIRILILQLVGLTVYKIIPKVSPPLQRAIMLSDLNIRTWSGVWFQTKPSWVSVHRLAATLLSSFFDQNPVVSAAILNQNKLPLPVSLSHFQDDIVICWINASVYTCSRFNVIEETLLDSALKHQILSFISWLSGHFGWRQCWGVAILRLNVISLLLFPL